MRLMRGRVGNGLGLGRRIIGRGIMLIIVNGMLRGNFLKRIIYENI
jgi:hypothetical protein